MNSIAQVVFKKERGRPRKDELAEGQGLMRMLLDLSRKHLTEEQFENIKKEYSDVIGQVDTGTICRGVKAYYIEAQRWQRKWDEYEQRQKEKEEREKRRKEEVQLREWEINYENYYKTEEEIGEILDMECDKPDDEDFKDAGSTDIEGDQDQDIEEGELNKLKRMKDDELLQGMIVTRSKRVLNEIKKVEDSSYIHEMLDDILLATKRRVNERKFMPYAGDVAITFVDVIKRGNGGKKIILDDIGNIRDVKSIELYMHESRFFYGCFGMFTSQLLQKEDIINLVVSVRTLLKRCSLMQKYKEVIGILQKIKKKTINDKVKIVDFAEFVSICLTMSAKYSYFYAKKVYEEGMLDSYSDEETVAIKKIIESYLSPEIASAIKKISRLAKKRMGLEWCDEIREQINATWAEDWMDDAKDLFRPILAELPSFALGSKRRKNKGEM